MSNSWDPFEGDLPPDNAMPLEERDAHSGAAPADAPALASGAVQLIEDVHAFLGRFVAYPEAWAQDAHALWVIHAHLIECFESTPRIAFLSPEPGSGKSRCLEVTEPLVPRPVHAVNATPAYLFRKVAADEGRPTILYDEIDTVFGPKAKENEDIRGMLNAGHRKGAMAGRAVVRGHQVVTEELEAYCAVALAGLNDLPDTIMTRAVVVRMKRRRPQDRVEPWRHRLNAPEGHAIRDRIAQWARSVGARAMDHWPVIPDGVEDRNADVWEALLTVAELIGGEWPERARVAAVTAVTGSQGGAGESLGISLLRDLRTVFAGRDRMFSDDIVRELCQIEGAPWSNLRGVPLDKNTLARKLSRYGVAPKQLRIDDENRRGYEAADLMDPWSRYLHAPSEDGVTSVTDATGVLL